MHSKSARPTVQPKLASARQPTSTTSRLIKLLQGRKGATMAQMTELTGWQPHSVRATLSRVLRKQRGLQVSCASSERGERCYRINGKTAP